MRTFSNQDLKGFAEDSARRIRGAKDGEQYFAEPFKHIVIDNFLPSDMAASCLEGFPSLEDPIWEHSNDPDIEVKYRTTWKSEFDIPDRIVPAVRLLNAAPFLLALAERMDIKKLIPDPYFTGGGLNATMRGGLLDVHVDGNYHDATGLSRRINAILYLNPRWEPGWGGEFGLYEKTGTECVKRVPPLFNRLVAFDTHDFSFHGLPEPLNFPAGEPRRSIILYYYTKEARPSSHIAIDEPHSALWMKRELTDKRGNKTREFT